MTHTGEVPAGQSDAGQNHVGQNPAFNRLQDGTKSTAVIKSSPPPVIREPLLPTIKSSPLPLGEG